MPADQHDGETVTQIPDGDRAVRLLEGFAMLGAASATTGFKRLKMEPGFPRPFLFGHRRFFLQSELLANLARFAAQRVGEQAPRVRIVAALIGPSLGASMKVERGSIRTRIQGPRGSAAVAA
ncbi:hypothetical protein [Panacagrimonas sp.]|uniref:hypothetical protein n=1 Tax=Panacagrimonas sp. TaxID=2480088 RepID=UPI003B5210CE